MVTDSRNLDDTSTWLPLEGLAPGFDANKAPTTSDLSGRDLTIRTASADLALNFLDASRVRLDGDEYAYEAVTVAPGLYWVQVQPAPDARSATCLVLDLDAGRALAVVTTIGPEDGPGTACSQRFSPGVIDGAEVGGEEPAPSQDLIGRRVMWVYSEAHAYEHTYLTDHWYTWQCLDGPEQGLADTDACTTYRVRPGIYVFAWREKVIPCAAVTIADHAGMRSHGMLFGLDDERENSVSFGFGAYGTLLSVTRHPDRYETAIRTPQAG